MTLDGRDVKDCSLQWLREQIAVVLQDTVLFSGTVRENIAYGTEATDKEVVAAAEAAAAHEFIRSLPDGYDTELGPQGMGLSGGQRQRIGIARTLLRNPPVIILDEPTTALDADSEDLVLEGLDRLMRGRTCLLITHSPRLARTADQIIELDHGRIVQTEVSPLASAVVTGCAGFIGSHLTESLLEDGHTVLGVDCFNDNYPRADKYANLARAGEHERFRLLTADLVAVDADALLEGADVVFHLAGEPGVRASWGPRFDRYTHHNVQATQRLLEAARETGVKFVYASSSSVYGDALTLPTPRTRRRARSRPTA